MSDKKEPADNQLVDFKKSVEVINYYNNNNMILSG